MALVHRLLDARETEAWRSLMVRVAPRLERWARGNRLLKRCRLAGDDDARAVMVSVLERLAGNDYENLRQFVSHTHSEPSPPEGDLVAELIRLAKLDDEEAPAIDHELDAAEGTPLRASTSPRAITSAGVSAGARARAAAASVICTAMPRRWRITPSPRHGRR